LANNLGNLLNRTLSMAAKYREGVIKQGDANAMFGDGDPAAEGDEFDPLAEGLAVKFKKEGGSYACLSSFRVDGLRQSRKIYEQMMGLEVVSYAVTEPNKISNIANLIVEIAAPWKLAKDPAQAERLDAVLYTLAESLRIIAILIWPVLPDAAHGIFDQLAWKLDEAGKDSRFRLADAVWGGLPDGHVLGKPVPLFPRIETAAPGEGK